MSWAALQPAMRLGEHGVRLADAGSVTEEDLEAPRLRSVRRECSSGGVGGEAVKARPPLGGVERQVEFENIDARLAQEAELTAAGVLGNHVEHCDTLMPRAAATRGACA